MPTVSRTLFVIGVLAASLAGQASFEVQGPACGWVPPIGCGAAGDPEGVSWNGLLSGSSATVPTFGVTVGTANGAAMPCAGLQFLRVQGANPGFAVIPSGGPIPEGGSFSRVWIPIPAGANTVSFCWDFYSAEGSSSAFNDAASLDFVAGCSGPPVSGLVYADTFAAQSLAVDGTSCGVVPVSAGTGVREVAAPAGVVGPQSAFAVPLVPGASHLRITVANSGDNALPSQFVVDAITFTFGAIPCARAFSAPFGPGSIMMANTPCPGSAGRSFFSVVDLSAGAFPTGWFYGVDVTLPELISEFTFGPPFTGLLDGAGASSSPGFGPAPTLSGLTLYGVTTEWLPGFGAFLASRPPTAWTIP